MSSARRSSGPPSSSRRARSHLDHSVASSPAPIAPQTREIELPAGTLAEAVAQFGPAAQQAVEEAARELQELRRQASSSIVIPEAGAASLKGIGGKGGIQLP